MLSAATQAARQASCLERTRQLVSNGSQARVGSSSRHPGSCVQSAWRSTPAEPADGGLGVSGSLGAGGSFGGAGLGGAGLGGGGTSGGGLVVSQPASARIAHRHSAPRQRILICSMDSLKCHIAYGPKGWTGFYHGWFLAAAARVGCRACAAHLHRVVDLAAQRAARRRRERRT